MPVLVLKQVTKIYLEEKAVAFPATLITRSKPHHAGVGEAEQNLQETAHLFNFQNSAKDNDKLKKLDQN